MNNATSTGDNDPAQSKVSSDLACTACKGAGYQVVAHPHPEAPYMLTIPFVNGECGQCFGTGSGDLQKLGLEKPGDDFFFLQFMSGNWTGDGMTRQKIKELQAAVEKWEESTNRPTKQGLRDVFAGIGMNEEQAELASVAASGYMGLKE